MVLIYIKKKFDSYSFQDGGCTAEPKCKTEVKCKPDPPKCPEPEKKCEKKCETKTTCTNPCERPTPCGQTRCGGLCMDRMYGCSYYAQQGYCQSRMYYAFMQNYCCATCRGKYNTTVLEITLSNWVGELTFCTGDLMVGQRSYDGVVFSTKELR